MLVHAVETYLRRNKEKFKDKLTTSHSKFGIKIKQKQILWPFIFPAILLDVDGILLAINSQEYPRLEHTSLNGTNCQQYCWQYCYMRHSVNK